MPAKDLDPYVRFNAVRYTPTCSCPEPALGESAHFLATGPTAWWAAGFT